MKKSNLITGGLYTIVGAVFLISAICIAIHSDSKIGGIFFGLASAGIATGIGMICQYFYWSSPKNRERYLERQTEIEIEQRDELNTKLRDKSGRYAYVLGIHTICISMLVFSILGALDIVRDSVLIVAFLGGYLLFQGIIGIVIFNHLLKKYK
ncbi:MAG: hypothetical protein IJ214_08160 [Clostridia bacterium]|nr:hypothetical protein [Clostridia bacterium]